MLLFVSKVHVVVSCVRTLRLSVLTMLLLRIRIFILRLIDAALPVVLARPKPPSALAVLVPYTCARSLGRRSMARSLTGSIMRLGHLRYNSGLSSS
jgi:hypothetical protein